MITFFALMFSILAISTDARSTPKVKVFEIVLNPESEELTDEELNKVQSKVQNKVEDAGRSDTDQLAMQLVTEIDILLSSQFPNLYSDSQEENGFIDKTRSSIVVMPPDSNKVYHIVRETIKPEANNKIKKRSKNMHWIQKLLQRREPEPEPIMKGMQDAPRANKLAMQLVSEIDMLIGQNPDPYDSESQEHSVFDETRSSIVVMPPDSDKVYHIVRDTVKKPEGNYRLNKPTKSSLEWDQDSQMDNTSNSYDMRNERYGQQLQDEIS